MKMRSPRDITLGLVVLVFLSGACTRRLPAPRPPQTPLPLAPGSE